jgi:hypothetical protein
MIVIYSENRMETVIHSVTKCKTFFSIGIAEFLDFLQRPGF